MTFQGRRHQGKIGGLSLQSLETDRFNTVEVHEQLTKCQ